LPRGKKRKRDDGATHVGGLGMASGHLASTPAFQGRWVCRGEFLIWCPPFCVLPTELLSGGLMPSLLDPLAALLKVQLQEAGVI
jgi:hypothetical protein